MPLNDESVQQLIDRAASDPDFRAGLLTDPVGTARAAGYSIGMDDVKAFLGRPGASDAELVEALKGRVSHLGSCPTVWSHEAAP